MLLTILFSFLSGLLTVLAPCVLPLLPVILGGSIDPKHKDPKRPYIIAASLIVSLIIFTILLKASTILIDIDPAVWTYISGGIVIVLGLFMLFPNLWVKISGALGFEHSSQKILGKASQKKNKTLSAILIGAALGPVFSSCNPMYAYVIATVLPVDIFLGSLYLAIYCIGVAVSLLAVALLGRKLLQKVKWATNPKGWFQRIIAILFILVGVFIVTGLDKKVQVWLVDKDIFGLTQLEQKLVPKNDIEKQMNDRKESNNMNDANSSVLNTRAYPAPELTGIEDWINSNPTKLSSLKGKVVLIDFWTYSCINCQRTQPFLNEWYKTYKDSGFEIIGVHAPEFSFEKSKSNVENAVNDAGIKYPVALDNSFSTWRAYNNRYWPAKYLIDKDGNVRYEHFGEGEYDKTEEAIRYLLKDAGKDIKKSSKTSDMESKNLDFSSKTPETYLGYARADRYAGNQRFLENETKNYEISKNPGTNQWSFGGDWKVFDEKSESQSDNSKLNIKFNAKDVFLVMSGKNGAKVSVSVDDLKDIKGSDVKGDEITIDGDRLYKIVESETSLNKTLELKIPKGVSVHAFTFG